MTMLGSVLAALIGLIRGPLFRIVEKLVPDGALKQRLQAEIAGLLLDHENRLAAARRDIVMLELDAESRLTRHWRPCLMYLLMFFLLLYGFLLPAAEAVVGHPIAFEPRWDAFPDSLWTLLMIGVGGYIGGRSIEKLGKGWVKPGPPEAPEPPPPSRRAKRR